ncbi:efflux RND transporter permease subunit, partial [Pseudomonas syringae group genomosp. 7]|uniref:efflux RND transporter permease subunit n=1 Tax=Pseudomonas syringae group genomosp. 7 TaxID=251699 RepID=UPI00376FFE49
MSAVVVSVCFFTMGLGCGYGSFLKRTLETFVIGGFVSSTALTLLLLPALYHWAHRREE